MNDTDPLMRLNPKIDHPGTDMGQYPKSTRQGYDLDGG